MITDKIQIDNKGAGLEQALDETERFCAYYRMNDKETRRMRLLAEETMLMLQELAMHFSGEFWLQNEGEKCSLVVDVSTLMTDANRQGLMGVSTSGKNLLRKGIMGKIGAFFDLGLSQASYLPGDAGVMDYGMLSSELAFAADPTTVGGLMWSLQSYRDKIGAEADRSDEPEISEAWDELQRSIIANIADDVQVGIRGGHVKMIVSRTPR